MPTRKQIMRTKWLRSPWAVLCLGLAIPVTSLAGEWVVFYSAPEASIYTDPSTAQQTGDSAQMWVLIDYKQPQADKTGKQVLSDKLHYQYDCKAQTQSIIGTSAYAGHMASGELVNENPDAPQIIPVEAGTLAEDMWKHAWPGPRQIAFLPLDPGLQQPFDNRDLAGNRCPSV